MAEWSPERIVDEALARRLIGAQYPELADAPMTVLGAGWDSTVWLLDGRLVFRFPRREVVLPGLRREMEALAQIAPYLPLAIPVTTHPGDPVAEFPWPWAGSPYLPGRETADAGLSDADRARHAGPLGRFLRALHDVDPADVTADGALLPVDPVRRADMPYRVDFLSRRLASLAGLDLWHPPPGLAAELRAALRLPEPDQLRICHGDLHLRHMLIGDDGEPSAVIDWIDVCRADPAIDLPLYWGHLPPHARPAFLGAYGGASDDQLLRARVLAVFLWATIAEFAHEGRIEPLLAEALGGLDRATADLR